MSGIGLIVGLGNPGLQYVNTRHNVGAQFLKAFATQNDLTLHQESKFHGLVAKYSDAGRVCWLLEPTTYMNESGRAVRALLQFYKLTPAQVLVVHDELDFPAGHIKLKQGGGHGGHNGLRDIISQLQTPDFYRLRIGIGHPGQRDKVTPYVLGEPSQQEQTAIQGSIDEGLRTIDDLMVGEFEKAMRWLHG